METVKVDKIKEDQDEDLDLDLDNIDLDEEENKPFWERGFGDESHKRNRNLL